MNESQPASEQNLVPDQEGEEAAGSGGLASETNQASPGDMLRALPAEAKERGSRLVSAQAMQARLFSVYDAAAAAEDALALVQQQLTVTLDRGYYEADEIERLASELDALLALEFARPDRRGPGQRGVGKVVSGRLRFHPEAETDGRLRSVQTRSLRVAMRSTGRWSPNGTGMAWRWVTPAWRKPASRSAT